MRDDTTKIELSEIVRESSRKVMVRTDELLKVEPNFESIGDRGRDTSCPVPPAQIRTGAH